MYDCGTINRLTYSKKKNNNNTSDSDVSDDDENQKPTAVIEALYSATIRGRKDVLSHITKSIF